MPWFFYDPTILILIPALLIGMVAQMLVNSAYRKYARVETRAGVNASQAAREMLDRAGCTDVALDYVAGELSDHYDPRSRVLRLSGGVGGSDSIAALGIAAHEVGHAIQHHQGYGLLKLRTSLVPVVNIGSSLAFPLVLLGLFFSPEIAMVGVALYGLAVIFQLVTLPVELNASARARALLSEGGYVTGPELDGVGKVLNAAAFPYLAAAIASILQLLRLFILAGGGRRRD